MDKIQAVRSVRRSGTFIGGGGFEARVVQENRRPNLVREEFTLQGYQSEMSTRLREIVNRSLIDFELLEVHVLPGDLEALLSFLGNPLEYWIVENRNKAWDSGGYEEENSAQFSGFAPHSNPGI